MNKNITDLRSEHKPLIDKEVYAISVKNNISVPLDIEYAKLKKVLDHRINQKYHKLDKQYRVQIPAAGTQDFSRFTFEEPNTKPAYPASTIPYSQGIVWE